MKRTVAILLLSGSLLAVGCSRPTAEAPAPATPAPKKSEPDAQKKQRIKPNAAEAHVMRSEAMDDKAVMTVSPSPSAPTPPP